MVLSSSVKSANIVGAISYRRPKVVKIPLEVQGARSIVDMVEVVHWSSAESRIQLGDRPEVQFVGGRGQVPFVKHVKCDVLLGIAWYED
jgi:hypothetical protein